MSAPGVRPTLRPLYRDGQRFIRIRTGNKWVEVHQRHLDKLIDELFDVRAPAPEPAPPARQALPL